MSRHTIRRLQHLHAKQRARERYNLRLEQSDLDEIISMIRSGRSVHLAKHTNRISEHELFYAGKTIRVCYDKIRGSIATILPQREETT